MTSQSLVGEWPDLALPIDGDSIGGNSLALRRLIRAEADETERLGRLTPTLVEAFRVAGLYRIVNAVLGKSRHIDVEGPAKQLTGRASGSTVLLLFLLFAVFAPIVEELFFRGGLQRGVERYLPAKAALVATAVLFAAAHFQPVQFPGLVIAGLVFGALAQRTGRLGAGMWAHATFNGTTVAALLWLK